MLTVAKYFSIFYIYSFLGWAMETTKNLIETKKFVNRGFLIGPYCPIYGFGIVAITALLTKYINDVPVMFCMSLLICGVLEYYTSLVMEKVFKARWWDYTNRKFNINGRVCLENLIIFGIAGVVLVKYANPFFLQILQFSTVLQWFLLGLSILFTIDIFLSFKAIWEISKTVKQAEIDIKDNTEEISKMVKEAMRLNYMKIKHDIEERKTKYKNKRNQKVRELQSYIERYKETREKSNLTRIVKEKAEAKSFFTRRLGKAFPNFEVKTKKKEEHKN